MPQQQDRERLKEVFALALERPKEGRASFLQDACGGDAALCREVESLLDAYEEPLLDREDFSASALFEAAGRSREGEQFGYYRVVRELGRGGMGAVYLAERADGEFERRVALKLMRRSLADPDHARRFRQERQILAALDQENIARLIDGGVSSDGEPYLVMEYVEGERIDDYCEANSLAQGERLRLFLKVCDGVAYAHRRLVVHRDIKPSNVLVAEGGTPKLLDFGIAKLLNPEHAGEQTRTEMRAFTPDYAAPEQVAGGPVTTATDVYALGVLLRKLLEPGSAAGVRPRPGPVSEPAPGGAAARTAATNLPTRPGGGADAAHNPIVSELRNIIGMATREEADRRYASVNELAEDVRRYLEGLPVRAQKDTLGYRASKFVRRHKAGVAATATVAVALLAGAVGTAWQARVARIERDRAQAAQVKAERVSQFLSAALSYSDPTASADGSKNRRDATINQMLDDVAPRIEGELSDQPEVRASLESTIGSAYLAQTRVADAERYLQAALAEQLRLYGEDHMETGRTLLALAETQNVKGDFDAAGRMARRAVAVLRSQRQNGRTDAALPLAEALALYGDVMWTKGDYGTSEAAFAEGLEIASRPPAQEIELAATMKTGLGQVRYAQGRLEEAAALLLDAMAVYRGSARARWRMGDTLNSLGQVLANEGKFDDALAALGESEAVSREQLGENSYTFMRSVQLRAYALCLKGDYAAAGRATEQMAALVARNFPEDKVTEANLYDLRGMLLTRTGRSREGEAAARRATELYQTMLLKGANGITLARLHWAESLSAQRRYDEAERILLDAYRDASEVQGARHLRTRQAAGELVKLYEAWGKPGLAAQYSVVSREK